ncbi:MAG: hypothetical protein WA188_20045, partial [Terriglobales bacterium]
MEDLPETVPGGATESNQPPPRESSPAAELAAPAAWERFKLELDETVPAGDGQEVSAINTVFTELMRAGMDADRVFDLVVTSAATLTGATGSAIALAEGGKFVCRASYGST